jgi:hypothetical protein
MVARSKLSVLQTTKDPTTMPTKSTPKPHHDRLEITFMCGEAGHAEGSQREACRGLGVPRSTLRDELARQKRIDDPVHKFLQNTVEGQLFLRRLVIAAHMVITMMGCHGVDLVCRFFELLGLGGPWACRMVPNMS